MYTYEFEKRKLYNLLGDNLVGLLKANKCILAGGAITSIFTNREINDYDIYFKSLDDIECFLEDIWDSNNWIVAETDKALLIKHNDKLIQLIYFKYFDKAEDIFETFDFTVCMGAFDFEREEFIFHEDFFKHNCEKILKFNEKTDYPIVSSLRVQKYEDKGYKISKPEFLRIILTCMNMGIKSYDEIKKQLGGMYGVNYDKHFKELEKEEFSLDKVIHILGKLIYDEDYFKNKNYSEDICYHDVEDVLSKIQGYKFKYFRSRLSNEIYKINKNNKLVYFSKNNPPSSNEEINAEELFNNTKFYKFVNKKEDKYFSFYDNTFEYIIGEEIVAKENKTGSKYSKAGLLYASYLEDIDKTSYSERYDKALLELEVKYDDFYESCGFEDIRFRKCKVIREVPYEEYKQYID